MRTLFMILSLLSALVSVPLAAAGVVEEAKQSVIGWVEQPGTLVDEVTEAAPPVDLSECTVDQQLSVREEGTMYFTGVYCIRPDPFDPYVGISNDWDRECEIPVIGDE